MEETNSERFTFKLEAQSKLASAYELLLASLKAMENVHSEIRWLDTERQDIMDSVGRLKEVGDRMVELLKKSD